MPNSHSLFSIALAGLFGLTSPVSAVPIQWVDWQSSVNDMNGFTATGVIVSGDEVIDVSYNNPQGIGFFQDGEGTETDWWAQQTTSGRIRNPETSPYTSGGERGVDNIPVGTDIIALRFAGSQTLSFSQPIGNLVFAFVSLNRNGYGFDQDFELLSSGGQNLDGLGTDDCGWWGCGTATKEIDGSNFLLTGTGEPHGALRFTGIFDSVTWESLSNEYWNGFTIGVQGTAGQVFPPEVPLPVAFWLFASGFAALYQLGRTRSRSE